MTSKSSSRSRSLSWRTRAPRLGRSSIRPFRRQHLERLAQRRSGDPKHLAELPFGNAGALWNVAFDHVVAKPQQDFAVQRGLLAVGDWVIGTPVFGNRGFHLHNSSLRNLRRRRSKSNTKIRLKRQKMNAKYLSRRFLGGCHAARTAFSANSRAEPGPGPGSPRHGHARDRSPQRPVRRARRGRCWKAAREFSRPPDRW